jgi:hypothetical protein
MKIMSEEELAARLDFRRPLHPAPEEPESVWCIPFEFGESPKGTRISIAAELRASVAEAELRQLRKHFEEEKKRADDLSFQLSKAGLERSVLMNEVAILKRRPRRSR